MNTWRLDFSQRIDYRRDDEITLAIRLFSAASFVGVNAKLDTGSKFCLFQPRQARLLGLDLNRGIPERIRTAAPFVPCLRP